jgi:hypothetical protein
VTTELMELRPQPVGPRQAGGGELRRRQGQALPECGIVGVDVTGRVDQVCVVPITLCQRSFAPLISLIRFRASRSPGIRPRRWTGWPALGYVAVCSDYSCQAGAGMIENYTVNGRTMIPIPTNAVMVNVQRAKPTPVQ